MCTYAFCFLFLQKYLFLCEFWMQTCRIICLFRLLRNLQWHIQQELKFQVVCAQSTKTLQSCKNQCAMTTLVFFDCLKNLIFLLYFLMKTRRIKCHFRFSKKSQFRKNGAYDYIALTQRTKL